MNQTKSLMADVLIGHSGFVGGTLLRQRAFDELYRSTNIARIRRRSFDTVVCAGAPAQKWLANSEPEADLARIENLIDHLGTIRCNRLILISTVDVFANPRGVDEQTPIDESALSPYGLHRRRLELFVESSFPTHLIIRLPGLVGPGLRKNVIFDLLNGNLDAVESRAVFQFYPTVNLWHDMSAALDADLRLVHLTAAPVSVSDVSREGLGREFDQTLPGDPVAYDMRSLYVETFGAIGRYQYTSRETFQAIRSYMQSEPRTVGSARVHNP